MYRAVFLYPFLFLSGGALAQTQPTADSSNTPLQLVYVIDGSTLTTYNVNSETFQATQVGTTALPQAAYPNLTPSSNGHVLYLLAEPIQSRQNTTLYVYSTNGSGVPGSQPIQTMNAKGLFSAFADPTGQFLYFVHQGTSGTNTTNYTIIRYKIDATTGKISQPATEAKYQLSSGTVACSPSIIGMKAGGTILYDSITCFYPHGGLDITYNQRTVNSRGVLGPDQQIYYYDNSNGYQNIQFANNLMFEFYQPINYEQNGNAVDVYNLQPNITTPIIQCTESMLPDCGSDYIGLAHPSGQYVFMTNQASVTAIDPVNLSAKQINSTSSTIPYQVQKFSPDGTLAFATNNVGTGLDIEICGFDVNTAQVAPGGLISVPSNLDAWFAVERQ